MKTKSSHTPVADQLTSLQKRELLQQILREYKSVIIALSGGLDSSYLLYASIAALGPGNVTAAIGVSPSLAKAEYEAAVTFARHQGLAEANVLPLETEEINDPNYSSNPTNRCYFCKAELYSKLSDLAKQRDDSVVCDGANASDIGDHRPGMQAAQEQAVRSPLLEARLTKADIRELAKEAGLEVWDKPASACLASRIPYGSEVTVEKLRQVEDAEAYLRSLGFKQLRVRHHGDLARIELERDEMAKMIEADLGAKIECHFRGIGFTYTSLDVTGFRTGKMNRSLESNDTEGK